MSASTYDSQARHPWRAVLACQSSALARAARDRLGPLAKGRNAARGLPAATDTQLSVGCTTKCGHMNGICGGRRSALKRQRFCYGKDLFLMV